MSTSENPLMPTPVLVCSDRPVSEVQSMLAAAGYRVDRLDLANTNPTDPQGYQLCVVDSDGSDTGVGHCKRLREKLGDVYVPILVLTGENGNGRRPAHLEGGADICLPRPCEADDFIAQVQALLRIKQRHDLWYTRSAEASRTNRRLQQAYQQIDQELELARRLQQSFLPQSLPQIPQVRFAVKYRSFGAVGGDFYDVFRLDENHLGFYVADAMGHGVPASLLTIFVKTAVKSKEIRDGNYRLVPPGEVLERLNVELLAQDLPDRPFVTMAYVLYNFRDGTFRFARSGHPYPLHIPKDGPAQFLRIEGSLLGVFETTYPEFTHQLQPGDKLLIYTDGMEAACFGQHPVGFNSLLAAAEHHRDLNIEELVERLASDLFGQTRQSDDLTVLGVECM